MFSENREGKQNIKTNNNNEPQKNKIKKKQEKQKQRQSYFHFVFFFFKASSFIDWIFSTQCFVIKLTKTNAARFNKRYWIIYMNNLNYVEIEEWLGLKESEREVQQWRSKGRASLLEWSVGSTERERERNRSVVVNVNMWRWRWRWSGWW